MKTPFTSCTIALALVAGLMLAPVPKAASTEDGAGTTPFVFRGDLRDLARGSEDPSAVDVIVHPRRWTGDSPAPPYTPEVVDPLLDNGYAARSRGAPPTTEIFAFEGIDLGAQPPDPTLDVGNDHVIQIVNQTRFAIYDKATVALVAGPSELDDLGSGTCATGSGNPTVLWDPLAERWLMSELAGSASMCVYVSMTDDPVSGGWCAYEFVAPDFPDAMKIGVWPDAYYVTSNETGDVPVYALDRENMLTCGTARPFQRLTAPRLSGLGFQAFTPADVDGETPPPSGALALFMRHRDTELGSQGPMNPTQDVLEIWAFDVDWDTPASSTLTQLPDILVSEFDSNLCPPISIFSCVPQPGTSTRLDPLLELIMNRLAYRNFGDHETLLGVFQTDVGDFADHVGERWFELRRTGGGAWTLHQEGTWSPDSDHRFAGTIAMDSVGNILLAYARSSDTTSPSVSYTGRLASDPIGTMSLPERTLFAGGGNNASIRFGDHSQMGVDPVDGCTFWMTVEYTEGVGDNTTGIGAVRFDDCRKPIFSDGFESGDSTAWSSTVP